MAQSAASQVADAVRPGSAPMQMLNQAADSTDRIAALIQAATGGDQQRAGRQEAGALTARGPYGLRSSTSNGYSAPSRSATMRRWQCAASAS